MKSSRSRSTSRPTCAYWTRQITVSINAGGNIPITVGSRNNPPYVYLHHVPDTGTSLSISVAIQEQSARPFKSFQGKMSNSHSDESQPLGPAIRRARLDRLSIFEVSESELETLERGSPNSLFLNLAIFVFSIAISFSVTLATTTIASIRTFNVFVIVTIVGYIAGITFGQLWWRSHKSVTSVVKQIRSRLPPEGVRAPTDGDEHKTTNR